MNTENARITVQTRAANNGIELNVIDNGKGFPEQVKAHAFEPYVTTKQKGTGLGLPIVKKIVDEHGGTIKIQNIQPHGAQISITLPALSSNNAQTATQFTPI